MGRGPPAMRNILDKLYTAAAYLAAFFMVGTLAMILASIFGRLFNFYLRGSDAYAGYSMAAASFLALAQTLRHGEHIRVSLILEKLHGGPHRGLEIFCHLMGIALSASFAWFSLRLVWQSYSFHDISQGNDATPLWIPQIAMALGTVVLCVAFIDAFVTLLKSPLAAPHKAAEALHAE